MIQRLVAGAVAVVALASCTGEDAPPGSGPRTSVSVSQSPSSTTPTAGPGVERLVVPAAAESFPETWTEAFVIPHGRGPARLGESQGAAAPDGTWWFLDPAKQRLAHYDVDGTYLEQVKVSRALGRTTFQWSQPHVLADGTFVAVRLDPPRSWLLRVRDGLVSEVQVRGLFSPDHDDGRLLYGSVGKGRHVVVDPSDGSRERTETFRTPDGTRFFVGNGFDNGRLRVELPDAAVSGAVRMRTASGAVAHVGVEVRAGADGRIHLFLAGTGEDEDSAPLVGYTSIDPTGSVAAVEALPSPFSDADPGSPAHLVVAPGSSTPMLVYVLDDGVHVYEREAG